MHFDRNANKKFNLIIRVMKLVVVIFILSLSTLSAGSFAQRFTLNERQAKLTTVLTKIERQIPYKFVYMRSDLENVVIDNITLDRVSLEDGLSLVFKNQGMEYKIFDDYIVVKKGSHPDIVDTRQQVSVKGSVTDSEGNPLSGVTITVKENRQIGTLSDEQGKYVLAVPQSAVLIFRSVGYVAQEIRVGSRRELNVRLAAGVANMDEVVVVGYGTQKKINLTGSVAVVDGDELENRPVVNATQSLQGLVPGLNVNVAGNTKPGQSFNLNVRGMGNLSGTDNPYVLVDGLEMSLADVNPRDIENISILKDASASAIYGSRAAYGVILVTTKKGSAGKTSITFSSNTGLTSPIQLPEMANSVDFANYFNAATYNATGLRQYSEDKIALLEQYIKDPTGISIFPEVNSNDYSDWVNSANGVANTNWFDLHYKPYALRQNYNMSLTGGNKDIQFYVSGGYYDEDGALRYADINYKRYNLNANVSSQLASWIKLKANTKYTKSQNETPLAGFERLFFHNLARMRPNVSPYDLNGNWSEQSMVPYLQSGSKDQEDVSTLALLTGLEIEPLKKWKIFVDLNMRQINLEGSMLKLPGTVYGIDGTPMLVNRSEYDIPIGGSYARNMENIFYISPNIYTNYGFSVEEKHNVSITLGYQQESNNLKSLNASTIGLISFARPGINLGTGDRLGNESRTHWATMGGFGRITYNFKEKFLFEVNGRYDGSSRFSSDQRWGFFPSFSAGYNLGEERFIQDNLAWLGQFKIRGSYGFLGNQAGAGLYSYSENMNIVVPGLNGGGLWFFNNGRESYIQAPEAFNPHITWENVENTNIGFDFEAFSNRLSGSVDFYQRNTRDMLGPSQDVADMYGATPPLSNNADLQTRGWELSVKWRGNITDDIRYSIGALISDNKSVVTKYQNPTRFNPDNAWYEGKNVGEIWGYRASGLIQSEEEAAAYNALDRSFLSARDWVPGDVKYLDINGDGKINNGGNIVDDMGDMAIIGNSSPRYAYSLNGSLSWKGISLSMLWQGIGKMDYSPGTSDEHAYFWGAGSLAQVTVLEEHLDYWTPENPNAYYPNPYASPRGSIDSYVNKTQLSSDRYLQNASYLRLKNLTINYSLQSALVQRLKMSRVNVFLSGENLLTITGLASMFDPETLVGGIGPGKIYPLSKVYSFGINVSF